jgi:aminoglycoside phosphotransferase (APT) family kinase protein
MVSATEAGATTLAGIESPALPDWLARHLPAAEPPFRFQLIAGGHSNLTYRVDDAGGQRFVLRRPPLGKLPTGAHDVAREYRIYAALRETAVPVPAVEALCEDTAIVGAPFYVMRWVDGVIVDSPSAVVKHLPTPALRRRAAENLVDVLAALHRLDVDAIGLGTLGPRENYLARQLERMSGVWQKTKTRELPLIESLHSRLAARRPPQRHTGIVHSDYRFGNVMVAGDASIVAVLDWELCALGDVLVDLGFLACNWDEPEDKIPDVWMQVPPTRAGEFPGKEEMVARYARVTGFDVSDLDYHRAFCYWRIAIIAEGIKRRYESGAMTARANVDPNAIERRVRERAELADQFLSRRER